MIHSDEDRLTQPQAGMKTEATNKDKQSDKDLLIYHHREMARDAEQLCAILATAYLHSVFETGGGRMGQAVRDAVTCFEDLSDFLNALAGDLERGK